MSGYPIAQGLYTTGDAEKGLFPPPAGVPVHPSVIDAYDAAAPSGPFPDDEQHRPRCTPYSLDHRIGRHLIFRHIVNWVIAAFRLVVLIFFAVQIIQLEVEISPILTLTRAHKIWLIVQGTFAEMISIFVFLPVMSDVSAPSPHLWSVSFWTDIFLLTTLVVHTMAFILLFVTKELLYFFVWMQLWSTLLTGAVLAVSSRLLASHVI